MSNIFGKLSGKGLAAIVCASLVVVGGAGVYSYTKLTDKLNSELISQNNTKKTNDESTVTKGTETGDKSVDAEITGIAKKEAQTTTETTETAGASAEEVDASAEGILEDGAALVSVENQVMVRPINGEILNTFSDGELMKSKTLNVWKTHDGVDITGVQGEKVKSMTSGTVIKVYDDQMLGATVIIDHGNGLEGYYSNLSKDISIAEGEKVSAGTVIGVIGNTAEGEINEEPHLHFAVKKNTEWIDPISLISGEGS